MTPPFRFAARLVGVLCACTLVAVAGCRSSEPTKPSEPAAFALRPTPFDALSGWTSTPAARSLNAFRRSCTELLERSASADMVDGKPAFGTVRDWQPACYRARQIGDTTDAAARRFFTRFFRPFRVVASGRTEGLFTGYYEPELQGAREPSERFSEPLHRRPSDLIKVPLGRFRSDAGGETIFGRVQDGTLVPYHSREEIARGKLAGRGLAIAWVDSRIDKFFLQIQGSGRVVLRDSSILRVGYAAENGRPYRAIGRDLIAMGAIPQEEMSMQAIRRWLADNPTRADALMNENPSYVFFRTLDRLDPRLGPLGAQGVPLTPEVSLAVDPSFLPYGAPLFLRTRRPSTKTSPTSPDTATVPFRSLMIAQDTGGAIRGAVRGDIFWGAGDRAREIAGRMKARGRYTVLLPRTLSP